MTQHEVYVKPEDPEESIDFDACSHFIDESQVAQIRREGDGAIIDYLGGETKEIDIHEGALERLNVVFELKVSKRGEFYMSLTGRAAFACKSVSETKIKKVGKSTKKFPVEEIPSSAYVMTYKSPLDVFSYDGTYFFSVRPFSMRL